MAKVQLDIIGKDKASGAVKGVTKSIITAQLAVEGIKIATKALIDIGKKSIEALRAQEQVLAKLAVQTDGNTQAIEEWTMELQKTTTVGDETALSMASLGLSMGITQEGLEDATKGAIGLSEALGIDLNTSMKMVALANEGEFNMLARYIPALRTATTDSEKMAIVQDAMAKGFELAEAKAETFTGKLDQLKNIQGDNLEEFGKIVSIVGKDFVDSMTDGATAINDFLTDTENIANIAATFEVLRVIITDLVKQGLDVMKESLQPLVDAWMELFSETEEGTKGFQILGGVVQLLSAGLSILGKFVKTIIIFWIDLIKTVNHAVEVFGDFYQALKGEKKWKDVQTNAKKTNDFILNMGKNLKDGFGDIIDTTIDEFKRFPSEAEIVGRDLEKTWSDTNKRIKKDFADTQADITDGLKKQLGGGGEDGGGEDDGGEDGGGEDAGASFAEGLQKGITTAILATQEGLGAIQEGFDIFYNDQFVKQKEAQNAALESVNDWMAQEMESRGVQLESKSEQLNREIKDLQSSITKRTSIEDKAKIESQIKEKKDELERNKIKDEAAKRREKILKRAAKEETALKKKQFEQNKALSIVNIWLSAAQGIMGAWAGAFQTVAFPPAAAIMAGVMTGLITTMAGVSTGLTAAQSFHGQEGGEIPVGTITGDRAVTFMNKGEALLRSEDYQALVAMAKGETAGGGDTFVIETMQIVANNPSELAEQLIEIRRTERAR